MTGIRSGDIVAGFDGTDRGADAVRLGALLARTEGAGLWVVRVEPGPSGAEPAAAARRLSIEIEPLL
jgi:hypothetical protein